MSYYEEPQATEADAMREYARNTAEEDPAECSCRGTGWVLTPYDTHVSCPSHYRGQRHPEDDDYETWGRGTSYGDKTHDQ